MVVTQLMPSSERDPGNRGRQTDGCEQRRQLAELINACAAGDRAAFRRLYDLSARFVFGVVLAVLRNSEMAEDVAQEVYINIWKRVGLLRHGQGQSARLDGCDRP